MGVRKKSALIKILLFLGEMSVMNEEYGLGMTWFHEHPNDGLYDDVIEGIKAL